jgi:hypothetical protein
MTPAEIQTVATETASRCKAEGDRVQENVTLWIKGKAETVHVAAFGPLGDVVVVTRTGHVLQYLRSEYMEAPEAEKHFEAVRARAYARSRSLIQEATRRGINYYDLPETQRVRDLATLAARERNRARRENHG